MTNFFYMEQIKFEGVDPSSRTEEFLNSMRRNQRAIDYIMIYLVYMHDFTYMQNAIVNEAFV